MITHYIKVAFRNLIKYRTQSIISIVGLAVGFTCFALATLWLRYESTYDSFHEDADRMYQLSLQENGSGMEQQSIYFFSSLAGELGQHFPEIESVCSTTNSYIAYNTPDKSIALQVDSSFLSLFNVRLLAGSLDFLTQPDQIALTEEAAARHFGSESPLGKILELEKGNYKKTVVAVVTGWGKHSNLPFDFLGMRNPELETNRLYLSSYVWVKLKKGVDVASFREKLYAFESTPNQYGNKIRRLEITPIVQARHELHSGSLAVQFHYLILFCITGGLVILCALFNYLSLFASRLRMRVREMALRKVCGSSNRRLFILLSMEFVLVLVLACTLGMAIIELTLPTFLEFTKVSGNIYGESLLYFAGLVLLAMLAFLLVVYYFTRRMLQQTLKGTSGKQGQPFFYRSSIVLQMAIGILFIFSITVIIKQLDHLRNGDMGMERKSVGILYPDAADNRAAMNADSQDTELIAAVAEKLRQLPFLTEVLDGAYALFPQSYTMRTKINDWEGKRPDEEEIWMESVPKGKALTKFYKFRLLKGELFSDSTDNAYKVLINETGAKQLGWSDPIGKTFNGDLTVIGMIKDFYNSSPTTHAGSMLVLSEDMPQWNTNSKTILIKYGDHPWNTVKNSIDSLMAREFPGISCRKVNVEEAYEKFLQSEDTLLKLLSIVAVVCILISAFGIYSFVTLTCERRRREIAIRKVNGAKVGHILLIFLKEYTLLLLIASAIAFSIGYVLMKRWLESYVEQTSISWWIYASVFAGIAFVVLLSIGSRVWIAARQNPAEVIKSE